MRTAGGTATMAACSRDCGRRTCTPGWADTRAIWAARRWSAPGRVESYPDRQWPGPGRPPPAVRLCDHYEPLWGKAAGEVGDAAGAGLAGGLPRAGARLPRRRRAAAAPLLLLPRRAVPARAPRRPGRAAPARLRRGRAAPAPRRRHRRQPARRHRRLPAASCARPRPLQPRRRRPPALRVHPRQLVPRQRRADGRWCGVDDEIPLLFETGCYADFTFPVGARRVPAQHRQPDLLAGRRSRRAHAPTSTASRPASAQVA